MMSKNLQVTPTTPGIQSISNLSEDTLFPTSKRRPTDIE